MMKFRRRRGSFSRRRRSNAYEMQQASFTREPLNFAASDVTLPTTDIFLMYHPRLEYAALPSAGLPNTLPIARGVVVSGIHHRLLISYVPPFTSGTPTYTAMGMVTTHSAIVKLPTDEQLVPTYVPNLFEPDVDIDVTNGRPVNNVRTLWRSLTHLRVFDGAVEKFNSGLDVSSTAGYGGGTVHDFIRTKSKVRLGMGDGLFLLVQSVWPFTDVVVPQVLGLDFWFAGGIKQMLSGPNEYI